MTTDDQKPRHKPSGKVTLEEVLKSLQDMIHTDLLEGEPVSRTPPAEKPGHAHIEEKQPKGREAPVIEDFAPPSLASGPVNLGAVMRSLTDLMNNELNVGDETSSSDAAGYVSPPLPGPETETTPEIEISPANDEDNLLESLASLSGDVSPPAPDTVPEPASTILEIETMELDATLEIIEAAPLPVDSSDTVQSVADVPIVSSTDLPEIIEEIVFETETLEFKPEPEPVEAAPLPSGAADTAVAPAGEIQVTFDKEGEAANTEQPVPESKQSGNDVSPGGWQQELLLDEAPARTEAPTILASEPIPVAATDSDATPAAEIPAPLESANTETLPTEPLVEPESPPEFLEPDAVLEIPVIETLQAPSALDRATMEMEIDAPVQETRNMPAIDLAIVLDEPNGEDAPAIPAAAPTAESAPAPSAADVAVDEIKIEAPVLQAMSMPSVEFNSAAPEKPSENDRPTAPSSEPQALKDDSLMPSVEYSPSPVTPAPSAQETPPASENKTSVIEPAPQPEAAPVKLLAPDTIPVLHEAVDVPTEKMAVRELMAETPPPSPDRARDAIIRAVAKLNIELRKAGGAGLDSKLVNRLQQYMREELEKSAKKEE